MNKEAMQYANIIKSLLDEILSEEESVKKAAALVGDSIMRDQVIHVIGPGCQSNMGVEEMFSRAGGFACINAILDPGTNLSHGGPRSMGVERVPGYAIPVLNAYRVGKTPGGANLYQSVDVFINNHLPYGDAILSVEGCEQNVGPTSTFCNCFTANYLVLETCKYLVSKGYTPPVFRSGNLPGGDEYNQDMMEKYTGKAFLLFNYMHIIRPA